MGASRKRRGGGHGGNHERWLLTYADLITLLLVFFIVLYSMSRADMQRVASLGASLQRAFNVAVLDGANATAAGGQGGSAQGSSLVEEFAMVRRELARTLQTEELPSGMSVQTTPDGILIRLANNIVFSSGRADVNAEAAPMLDSVAALLQRMSYEVRVEGHTDNVPINTNLYASNWELSAARALAVTHYLIERGGVTPERLSAVGYGEHRPIADNLTRESRALNRRTDILLVAPRQSGPVPAS